MRRGRGWRSNDSLAYLPVQSCQVLPESPFYILTRGEVVVRAKEGDETVCTKQARLFFTPSLPPHHLIISRSFRRFRESPPFGELLASLGAYDDTVTNSRIPHFECSILYHHALC